MSHPTTQDTPGEPETAAHEPLSATETGADGAGVPPATPVRQAGEADPPGAIVAEPDRFIDKRDGLLAQKITQAVSERGPIGTDTSGHLYCYADGIWRPDGRRVVTWRVQQMLGDKYRRNHADTVTDILSTQAPTISERSVGTEYLNLPNGLLDWRSGTLYQHSPAVPSLSRIPVVWNPHAVCPDVHKWLNEVLPPDAIEFAYEVIGYTLLNDNPMHKAVLLFGRGRNGKGTFLNMLTALVGADNVSAVTPQSLDDNRFRAAELYGKLANLVGDVDPRIFKATETFKQVTGGDMITAERKHGQPFTFTCRALMVAGFNSLPRSADTSEGFFSRWLVLPFVGYFPPNSALTDVGRKAKLTTGPELEGLLVQAVQGLQRVMSRGRFDVPASVADATGEFRRVADPVRSFMDERTTGNREEFTARTHVLNAFKMWAHENGYADMSANTFYERLEAASVDVHGFPISAAKRQGIRGYRGLSLPPRGVGAYTNDDDDK